MKKTYRVTFLQEEYLHTFVEAEDEEEAREIASELEYEDFKSGDCDLTFIDAQSIED